MISKESVYMYLTEGLLSEGWFNFKEDDPQPEQGQTQTQDPNNTQNNNEPSGDQKTKEPNLNWNFYKKELILYSGSPSDPDSQYYPFADEIRYAEFKKDKEKDNKDKNKAAKDRIKDFGLAVAFGGVVSAAAQEIRKNFEPNKKDKNGKTDKWEDYVVETFKNLNDFKKHAEEHHVPSSLIDSFITSYKELKLKASNPNNANAKSNANKTMNQQQKPTQNSQTQK